MKLAVDCGYWPLYRYNPQLAEEGKNPFTMDSKAPTGDMQEFLRGEVRYSSLIKQFPDIADGLLEQTEKDAMNVWTTTKIWQNNSFHYRNKK